MWHTSDRGDLTALRLPLHVKLVSHLPSPVTRYARSIAKLAPPVSPSRATHVGLRNRTPASCSLPFNDTYTP